MSFAKPPQDLEDKRYKRDRIYKHETRPTTSSFNEQMDARDSLDYVPGPRVIERVKKKPYQPKNYLKSTKQTKFPPSNQLVKKDVT